MSDSKCSECGLVTEPSALRGNKCWFHAEDAMREAVQQDD